MAVKMEDPPWTALDEQHAKLFHPFDQQLPWSKERKRGTENDPLNRLPPKMLQFLRHLDKLIVDFDQSMGHSDWNIKLWCKRHQQAMDNQLTNTPTYPALKVRRRNTMVWEQKAWENRYSYLVDQRLQLIEQRLKELGLRHFILGFFRDVAEKPRRAMLATLPTGKTRARVLCCNWWQPIDQLVGSLATYWEWDPVQLVERFWDPNYPSPPAEQDVVDLTAFDGTNIKEEGQAAMESVQLPYRFLG